LNFLQQDYILLGQRQAVPLGDASTLPVLIEVGTDEDPLSPQLPRKQQVSRLDEELPSPSNKPRVSMPPLIDRRSPELAQIASQGLTEDLNAPDISVGELPVLPPHEEDFDDDEGKMHAGTTGHSMPSPEASPEQRTESRVEPDAEIPDRSPLSMDASRQPDARDVEETSAPVLRAMQDMAAVVQDLKARVQRAESDNQQLRREAATDRKEYRPFQGSQMLGLAEPWIADRYIAQELKRHALFGDPVTRQPESQRSRELRLMLFSLLVDSLGEWRAVHEQFVYGDCRSLFCAMLQLWPSQCLSQAN